MKVAGYIRVSTPSQVKEGEGLNTQRELIEKYVKDKGLTVHNIYSDEGLSGAKSGNRPGLQQLMKDAGKKYFEAVIISRLSRFGRNARELLNNIHILREAEVSLISIKEQIDLSTSYGRAMVTMLAAIVELEREIITEQMGETKNIKWQQHRMFNGKPPYGYFWNKDTKKLEINTQEEGTYKKIVDLYLNHGLSLKDIGIKLKENGIICKKRPFNSSTLSYILKNPAYYGYYVVNQHKYKDGKRLKEKKDTSEHITFPVSPIISKASWDKIQEKTSFNKLKGKRVTISSPHWLRDMLQCGECGGRIKPRYGNRHIDGSAPVYYCCFWSKTSKKDLIASGKKKCLLRHIHSETLEKRIWSNIWFHLTRCRDHYLDSYHNSQQYDSLIKDKNKHLEKITNEIAKQNRAKDALYMLLQEPGYNKKEFLSRLHSINEEINELQSNYKDRRDEMQELIEGKEQVELIKKIKEEKSMFRGRIGRELNKMSSYDRKRLAENMFGKILICKDRTDPDGFKISYQRYGPVTVLEQLVSEGKLPSFNLNG